MTDPLATRGPGSVTDTAPAARVVQTWKNHLDIGFTEGESKVVHDAVRWLLPSAAALGARLRREHGAARFTWTVPSWLVWHALETLRGGQLETVEAALAAGDLRWHALPATCHSELMDRGLADFGLSLSRRLDARFGRRTRCAKQTDVPGHARGLIGALADAGVQVLHVGVNWMSAMPDVPPAFRWRDMQGREVVVLYEAGYGNRCRLPGDDSVLLWRIIGDNMEVPSAADVAADWEAAARDFPGVAIVAGGMDDWAGDDLPARAASLPVITGEIGDSWIHGTGTDPWKTQRLRALMRLARRWGRDGRLAAGTPAHDRFHEQLLLVCEHTWGVSMGAHTGHDERHWDNADFARVRNRGCWRLAEASWQEQRDHIDLAIDALERPDLRDEASTALAELQPRRSSGSGWSAVDAAAPIALGPTTLRLDARGAVTALHDGQEHAAGPLALLRYQTFDASDCRRFVAEYCRFNESWLLEEFTKSGLEGSSAVSRWWEPRLLRARRRGDTLRLELTFPAEAVALAGAPAEAEVELAWRDGGLDARLELRRKHPTRLPEALWWSFVPRVADPRSWRLDKLGEAVDPCATVRRGGTWLHGVGDGTWADGGAVRLDTPDAHLIAVGEPQLYRFPDQTLEPAGGLHLNLCNNLWGTNFPMWCGDDLAWRARLAWRDRP